VNLGIGTFLKNGLTKESIESAMRRTAAAITGGFLIQHKEDGTHTDVTADTVQVGSDPADGSWGGNVSGSLVPTSSTQDLGATITQATNVIGDHPWRHLRLSGSVTFTPFTANGSGAVDGFPVLSRSERSLTLTADAGDVEFVLSSGGSTHTFTIGMGLLGLTTNRAIECAALTATGDVRASHLQITDGISAPSSESGIAKIYVDTADGDLKVKFGDGTVKTIVTDT
jgi:hypothetical protein